MVRICHSKEEVNPNEICWLEARFENISNSIREYPNKHANIKDNQTIKDAFYPHITLMRFSKKEFTQFHITEPYLLSGQKLKINKILSCQHNKPGSTIVIDSVELK